MLSAIGFQVVPAFSVFQTPPEPTATYHTFSLVSSIAISAILPDINAGPTLLNLKLFKAEAIGFSSFFFSFFFCAIPSIVEKSIAQETNNSFKYFITIFV